MVPFAEGGATSTDNLALRCRAHNAYEAERWFGSTDPPAVREVQPMFGGASVRRQCVVPTRLRVQSSFSVISILLYRSELHVAR